jgi:hypothetical protein
MGRKDPISHLSRHPFELPPRLVDEVLALGRDGVERLIAIAADRGRWVDEPVLVSNALAVLARAGDPSAIDVVATAFAESEPDDLIYARAAGAMQTLRGPELAARLLATPVPQDRLADSTMVLSACGVEDPRIEQRIRDLIRVDPEQGAFAAVSYGRPELVPALQAAFDALEREPTREVVERGLALLNAVAALAGSDEAREASLTLLAFAANDALRQQLHELRAEIGEHERMVRTLEALGEGLRPRRKRGPRVGSDT